MLLVSNKKIKKEKAFTLVEVLLVIAVIGILVGLSAPVFYAFQVKNNLNVAVDSVVQSTRRAQLLSQSVDGDDSWGVKVNSGSVVIFQGGSYASRDVNFDEVIDISNDILISGWDEIVFSKFFADPSTTGMITLTSPLGNVASIDVNSKGMVNY